MTAAPPAQPKSFQSSVYARPAVHIAVMVVMTDSPGQVLINILGGSHQLSSPLISSDEKGLFAKTEIRELTPNTKYR